MFIPNGLLPSFAAHKYEFDEEGRLHEFNLSRQSTGGISEVNSNFATEAEMVSSKAPFLKRNIAKDVTRRNYVVCPGGRIAFNPLDAEEVKVDIPTPQESFGHSSLHVTKMAQGSPGFTLGGK